MLAPATQQSSVFLKLGRIRGPGDPDQQSKFQEDLTLFSCRCRLKLGGVRGLKLKRDGINENRELLTYSEGSGGLVILTTNASFK